VTKEERTQCPVEGYGGAGHFLMLGKSAEVANEIRGFLEEVVHGASIAPWPAAYLEIIAPDSEQLVSLMLAMASSSARKTLWLW